MKSPKLSVLMPNFNNQDYLKEAINSVLNQTFKNFEFIIVDDCSKDNSVKLISEFKDKRIRLLRNKRNLGVSKSLNKGLKICKGEYIARFDSDDICFKDRFAKQVKFLDREEDCVLVGSNAILINEKGKRIGQTNFPLIDAKLRSKMFIRNSILHPSVMIRRTAFKKIGNYSENLNGVEDYDLFFRLMKVGKVANIEENLIKRRIHENVVTKRNHLKIELLALIVRMKYLINI